MLDGVTLLAGHTARSQAYLQALVSNGLAPAAVILLGEPEPAGNLPPSLKSWQGLQLPDLSETLAVTCERAGIPLHACSSRDVNTDEVAAAISRLSPAILVYSGYGGQIVSDRLLGLGPRFLHLHSGRLPEYRGSTTLYYALLNGDPPGVSALILDRKIDTGPVVARRHYPVPPSGMDLDRVYDSAIRADLLVRVMREYADTGDLGPFEPQLPDAGTSYYVVHPVLKHLALLSLDTAKQSS